MELSNYHRKFLPNIDEQSPTLDENNELVCCIDLLHFWYVTFL